MGSSLRRLLTCIFIALLVDRVIRLVYGLGFHRSVYTHHPGPCRELPGIVHGSEDIVTASNGLAFISSGVLKVEKPNAGIKGKIFIFDFNKPNDAPKEVKIEGDFIDTETWLPVGMDLWESGSKDTLKITLYVINRNPGDVGIEVFDFLFKNSVPTLRHKKTIQHKIIRRPNDLVVVDENRFYLTNDGYLPRPFDNLEMMLSLPSGNVIYFDGLDAKKVADNFRVANGINVSPNQEVLYVAELLGQYLHIYKTSSDGSLTFTKSIGLDTSPDNIDVDKATGDLWIGSHKMMYPLMQEIGKANGVGQILRIQLDADLNPTIREVLADDTGLVRGSSIANRYGNAMLVGTIADKAAYCNILAY